MNSSKHNMRSGEGDEIKAMISSEGLNEISNESACRFFALVS